MLFQFKTQCIQLYFAGIVIALCYFNEFKYLILQFSPIFIDKIKHIKENRTYYGRIPYLNDIKTRP